MGLYACCKDQHPSHRPRASYVATSHGHAIPSTSRHCPSMLQARNESGRFTKCKSTGMPIPLSTGVSVEKLTLRKMAKLPVQKGVSDAVHDQRPDPRNIPSTCLKDHAVPNSQTETKTAPARENGVRRTVAGVFLEAQLYSQSERDEGEVLKAAVDQITRWSSEVDKFQEVKRAAGSVFC